MTCSLEFFMIGFFNLWNLNIDLVLGSLLVNIGLGIVSLLVKFVANGVFGSSQTIRSNVSKCIHCGVVAASRNKITKHLPSAGTGVAVLGNLLVGLVAGAGDGTLDGLRDVVGGLLDGLHCECGGWRWW